MRKNNYSTFFWLKKKILLSIIFAVFFSCLNLSAQGKKISLKVREGSLVDLLTEIEKKTSYTFVYNNSDVDIKITRDIEVADKTVTEILERYFVDFDYFIEGNTIVLKPKKYNKDEVITIKGSVKDENGEPLIGVLILIQAGDEKMGAHTNLKGSYVLQAPKNAILKYSYLGYESFTVPVNGRSLINISMKPENNELNEVVVTALGMTRQEKSLGYSVSKVDSEEMTNAKSHNWIGGLAGKVPGLSLQYGSAGPGGTARVVLRGESSFNMSNNEALFVVDGVPIQNKMISGNEDLSVDYGNPISDIDPENIESVTVLKGASAAALYGARAGNGVIVITTKSGSKSKGLGVTVRYDLNFEHIGHMPDFQYEYGAGNSALGINTYSFRKNSALGTKTGNTTWAFGPRFDSNVEFYQYEGWNFDNPVESIKTPWIPRKNWYTGFYQTGVTHTTNVTLAGSDGKKLNARASITLKDNDWIIPNTGYSSQNIFVSSNYKISDKIDLKLKLTYYRKDSDNLPAIGYNISSPTYALLWSSNHLDINWLKDYWQEGQENIQQNNAFNTNWDNPYFVAYEYLNTLDRDRLYGNIAMTYNIIKGLSLMLRVGVDSNQEFRTFRKPWSSKRYVNGYYREQNVFSFESNADFLIKYDKQIGNFAMSLNFGGNNLYQTDRNVSLKTMNLRKPGIYSLQNTSTGVLFSSSGPREKVVNSLFGLIQLSYKDAVYLDITGRNDWSSTLPINNNSYFFPSVSSSVILNELIDFSNIKQYLSFAKLRLSWAMVGIDTTPYKMTKYYSNTDWSSSVNMPTLLPPDNLLPEMVESYEAGADLRFFNHRIGLDVNYYFSKSFDLIINMPIAESTGYYNKVTNTGEIWNYGTEIALNFQIFDRKDLAWNAGLTFAANKNKVVKLADGIDTWIISEGPSGAGRIEGRIGGSLGDLYGNVLERAPEGSVMVNPDGSTTDCSGQIVYYDGYPKCTTTADSYLGNTQPIFKSGLYNSIKYKNFTFNFTFDAQYGGQIYSLSHSILSYSGKLTNSLDGRYDGIVGDGVMMNADGQYVKNTVVADDMRQYYGILYKRENTEYNTFDTSFIKLREVKLEYKFPSKLLQATKFIKGASLSLYGTNLLTITKFPMFDPEINTLNGAEIQAGFELGQLPSTRSFGFSASVNF